jgi:hypothetical protein
MELWPEDIVNPIASYFDLRSPKVQTMGVKRPTTVLSCWPQYAALVTGIVAQPFFAEYQLTHNWNLHGVGGRAIFSVIVGIIVFPSVYKNAFDPDKPIFVQLCAIFAAGMGWQSLLHTTMAAADSFSST